MQFLYVAHHIMLLIQCHKIRVTDVHINLGPHFASNNHLVFYQHPYKNRYPT